MIPCGFESFSLDSAFESSFLFEQVERYAVKQREVLRRMACSFSVQIFAKAHVEYPVQFVFDAPVLTNHAVQTRRIGLEAGDVVANLALGLACGLVVTLALDTYQALKRGPLRGFVDHAQVGDHRA